jgi:hypothetical protein
MMTKMLELSGAVAGSDANTTTARKQNRATLLYDFTKLSVLRELHDA